MKPFATRYSHTVKKQIDQTGQKSLVRTSEQAETDINVIMERFNRSGKLPAINQRQPRYGDARGVDYATALIVVKDAQEAFMKLPASTRKRFDNDPQEFEAFLADPSNDPEAIKLGLKDLQGPSPEALLHEVAKNTRKETPPKSKE